MKAKHAAIAIIALALAVAPLMADGSDAAVKMDGDVVVNGGFSDMGGGSITVTVQNDSAEAATVTVGVYEMGGGLITSSTFEIPGGSEEEPGSVSREIGFSYDSAGDKYVTVKLFEGAGTEGTPVSEQGGIMIHVTHSIWKDSTTYVLIILAIVVVAIVLYVRARGNPLSKSKKDEVSFADLNRERRERKRPAATERKRYEGKGKKGN